MNLAVGALDPQAGGELPTEAARPRPDCSALCGGAKSVGWWPIAYGIRNNRINFEHPEIFGIQNSSPDCEFIGGALDPQVGGELITEAASPRPD